MTTRSAQGRSGGFTLIELLVTLTVLALVMAFAMPAMSSIIMNSQLTSYANTFAGAIQAARSEAVKRNGTVSLCRSADGASCATTGNFQQGWIIFRDVNANGSLDTGETLLEKQGALSTNYSFTSTAYALIFQPSGVGSTNATLVLCRSNPVGERRRDMALSSTGRLSISTVSNSTTCP